MDCLFPSRKVSLNTLRSQPEHLLQIKDGYVVLNFAFIEGLRSTVKALVAEYDKEVISGNLLRAEDTQP